MSTALRPLIRKSLFTTFFHPNIIDSIGPSLPHCETVRWLGILLYMLRLDGEGLGDYFAPVSPHPIRRYMGFTQFLQLACQLTVDERTVMGAIEHWRTACIERELWAASARLDVLATDAQMAVEGWEEQKGFLEELRDSRADGTGIWMSILTYALEGVSEAIKEIVARNGGKMMPEEVDDDGYSEDEEDTPLAVAWECILAGPGSGCGLLPTVEKEQPEERRIAFTDLEARGLGCKERTQPY